MKKSFLFVALSFPLFIEAACKMNYPAGTKNDTLVPTINNIHLHL